MKIWLEKHLLSPSESMSHLTDENEMEGKSFQLDVTLTLEPVICVRRSNKFKHSSFVIAEYNVI